MEISYAKVLISTQPIIKILRFCSRSLCTLISLRESKPGYQRSVGQVFACYGIRRISQSPAVEYCKLLASLPESLDKTYLVNSGTEAIEGLKLARRVTGRSQLISPQCLSWKHHGSFEYNGF
jgi:hypothetical protein